MYLADYINKTDTSVTLGMNRRNARKIFVRKPDVKCTLGRPGSSLKNIKILLGGIKKIHEQLQLG